MGGMERSVAIANAFLGQPGGDSLTQMQLQKLVFFAHGWTLAETGYPLTEDDPEAWVYGPVYRDLYDHTKFFGSGAIGRKITPDDDEAARFFLHKSSGRKAYLPDLDGEEASVIKRVWKRYGALSGPRLSAITHRPGTPWATTFAGGKGKNRTISDELTKSYFKKLQLVEPL
jgi:uncharacterized phage-associated protein